MRMARLELNFCGLILGVLTFGVLTLRVLSLIILTLQALRFLVAKITVQKLKSGNINQKLGKGNFMTQLELDKILELHKKFLNDEDGGVRADLRDANLRGANLGGAYLRGAYLVGADLRDANLRDAKLAEVDLRDADLRCADLRGAKLVDAKLQDANLGDADLRGADLRGADLGGAYLRDADLVDANLSGADLSRTCVQSFTLGKHFGYSWVRVDKETQQKEIIVRIGCEEHPMKHWKDNINEIGLKNSYTQDERLAYASVLKTIRILLKSQGVLK